MRKTQRARESSAMNLLTKGIEMNTETKPKKKMGRPLKPGGPVSNKDRQQQWRDRVRADAQTLLAQLKLN
jgi:hypothetical protein